MRSRPRTGPLGFTLVELLVVIAIIALISAIALPMILPALNERRVSESARILQAILAGTRDQAIRANAPRGIRLLPDPVFNGQLASNGQSYNPLASNRIIPIEPGPDYTEGLIIPVLAGQTYTAGDGSTYQYLVIQEVGLFTGTTIPSNPTNWSLNVRQGDKLRFNDSGAYYTIAGPVNGPPFGPLTKQAQTNSERVISCSPQSAAPLPTQAGWLPEYLILMNGQDDNGNGWIDEACDGIDNDGDGIVDPGFNGIDDDGDGTIDNIAELAIGLYIGAEYEQETFLGAEASVVAQSILTNLPPQPMAYTIYRRPVVSPGARETTLPEGIVIDLTTWNLPAATPQNAVQNGLPILLPERSRLPVDAYTGYVDIMIDQTGRVIPPGAGMDGGGAYGNSPLSSLPFYHFWLTEREGVVPPAFGFVTSNNVVLNIPNRNSGYGPAGSSTNYVLPMPNGTPNYTPPASVASVGVPTPYLTGERRLITLFVKTGQITSNSIMNFNGYDTNTPFYDAQAGIKEPQ